MSFSRHTREETKSSSPELPPALRPQSRQSNKRKRTASSSGPTYRSASVPSSINPRSHSPSTVRQLSVAGVPIEDDDPTQHISHFPHRRLPRKESAEDPEESEWTDVGDDDDQRPRKPKRTPREPLTGHNAVLLHLIYENLDRGDIEAASRFYGHLLQLRDRGMPITARQHNLWAIGAEILMREGERPVGPRDVENLEGSREERDSRRRWGRAANMPKVRAYYDTLIREFPYDYRHPEATNAVDFWLALINCEFYNTHTEQVLALERIDDPDGSDDNDDDDDDSRAEGEGHHSDINPESGTVEDTNSRRREKRVTQRKETLRKRTLSTMEGLAARMDELCSEPPYSKHHEFKRLRAMIALYVADLLVPYAVEWEAERRAADERKRGEQEFARDLLQRVQRNGGQLDRVTREFADPEGEWEQEEGREGVGPVYSSLPIRGA